MERIRSGRAARGCIMLLCVIGFLGAWARDAVAAQPVACTYGSCAPSSTTIAPQITRQATAVTNELISDRIENAFNMLDSGSTGGNASSNGSGALGYAETPRTNTAAFDALMPAGRVGGTQASADKIWHTWANFSSNWMRSTETGADYHGTLLTGVVGIDARVMPDVILGVVSAYQRLDLKTSFNAGTLGSDGYALGGYGIVRIAPAVTLDLQAVHTWLNYSETHGTTSGRFNGSRWSGAADLRAQKDIGNWALKSSFGFAYQTETQFRYQESDGSQVPSSLYNLGQARARGQIGYHIKSSVGTITPWAATELDLRVLGTPAPILDATGRRAALSPSNMTFEVGVDNQVSNDLSLSVRLRESLDFQHRTTFGVMGSLRYQF